MVLTPDELQRRKRRNLVLALVHVLVVLGILAAFVYVQSVK